MALPVFRRSDAGVRLAHIGVREPCLPFGVTIEVQVPPWTNFHELPWKSTVELPWQVVPGPAAQSFWPLRATPKHFSLWAAIAAAFSASVKGPAEAMVASALESAKARTSEATAVLADMRFLRFVGWPSSGAIGRRVRVRKRYIGPLHGKMTRQPMASRPRRVEAARAGSQKRWRRACGTRAGSLAANQGGSERLFQNHHVAVRIEYGS